MEGFVAVTLHFRSVGAVPLGLGRRFPSSSPPSPSSLPPSTLSASANLILPLLSISFRPSLLPHRLSRRQHPRTRRPHPFILYLHTHHHLVASLSSLLLSPFRHTHSHRHLFRIDSIPTLSSSPSLASLHLVPSVSSI